MWHTLPDDIILYILLLHSKIQERYVINIQAAWKGYKTRILVGRFRLLRNTRPFRFYNPNIHHFVMRSKL